MPLEVFETAITHARTCVNWVKQYQNIRPDTFLRKEKGWLFTWFSDAQAPDTLPERFQGEGGQQLMARMERMQMMARALGTSLEEVYAT